MNRRLVASMLCVASALTSTSQRARGQTATPPISEWHHTSWTGDRGPPVPGEHDLMRSPDGYLWMSASRGILRFDGVRFTLFDSASTPEFRTLSIGLLTPRLVDRDSAMWLSDGNNSWLQYRNGHFRVVARGDSVTSLGVPIQDGRGQLWSPNPRVRMFRNGKLVPAMLPASVPDSGLSDLIRDNATGIWIGTHTDHLWHIDGDRVEHFEGAHALKPMFHAKDGTLWGSLVGKSNILGTFRNGVVTRARLSARDSSPIIAQQFREAPDGSIWIATTGDGVLRWRNGVFEQFTRANGLSSESVHSLWIDAEGAAWITTDAGLDRLRPSPLLALNERRGFPFPTGYTVVEDITHRWWTRGLSTQHLVRMDGGLVRNVSDTVTTRQFNVLGDSAFQLLSAAHEGGVWVAPLSGGLARVSDSGVQRFDQRSGFSDDRFLLGLTARSGVLWLTMLRGGLGRFENGRYRKLTLFGDNTIGVRDLVEDGNGNIWVLTRRSTRLGMLHNDSIVREVVLPKSAENSNALALEGVDTLWVPTYSSIVRIVNGVATEIPMPTLVTVLRAAPDAVVSGGSLWLSSTGGIARLSLSELHRAAGDTSQRVTPVVFSSLDGVDIPKATARAPFKLLRVSDGRVLFATPSGIAIADPSYSYRNNVPAEPRIEDVSVSDSMIALENNGTIAPNPDRLTIRFSAPSLGLAERVRLEFRLDGADVKWNDGSQERTAVYTQLRPGSYTFHVRSWNESGVPGTHEAVLRFRVLRAWYQSFWFYALCIALLTTLIYVVVHMVLRERTRQANQRTEARFRAVLDERTRIARELHDTLLQGFTGITLHLETVRGKLVQRADDSANDLSEILTYADSTLREAREMVWDIRAPHLQVGLMQAIVAEGRRVINGDQVKLEFAETGMPRRLQPYTETTIVRVAREAMVNALKHADPTTVSVGLHFAPRAISLTVTDDGRGSDAAHLELARAGGHWGLSGMRERATRAGGTLDVQTAPGEGMRVILVLPIEPVE